MLCSNPCCPSNLVFGHFQLLSEGLCFINYLCLLVIDAHLLISSCAKNCNSSELEIIEQTNLVYCIHHVFIELQLDCSGKLFDNT